MSTNKLTLSKKAYTGIALLFIAIMAMLLFEVEDKLQICLLLLTISLVVISPLSFRQWTVIDISLNLITIYNMVSCLYAGCSVPAIRSSLLSIFCLTSYLVLRKLFSSERSTRIILQGSYLPIGIALLLAICSFLIFRQSVLSVGFQDTYHFRFLFRPLGYITNVWAEVLLILLGWVCLVRRYSTLFIFMTVLAILFSFSRGAYIALGTYIITWLLLVKPKREKTRLLAISIAAIILTGIFFPNEMKTTLQMNRTASQQQSTEGRVTATQTAWDTFTERPLFGYGNYSYTFAVDQILNQDSRNPYTSYAPNIMVLLLIEKGIVGILLYLLLVISICITIWKYRKRSESRIISCTMLALAVKEMTQATLFSTPFSLFMLYVLLAFLQKEELSVEKTESQQTVSRYMTPCFVLLCYLSWSIFNFLQIRDKSHKQLSEMAWKKGELTEAIRLMEQTSEQTPNLINRGLLYIQSYRKTEDQKYLQAGEQTLEKAYHQQPEDIQIRYLLAKLYLYGKESAKAYPIAKELATNYPKNSLYLSALSDALYQQGDKEAALHPLINAIRYTPRLLTGLRIRDLQQTDSVFYNNLLQHISKLEPAIEASPADYARYGYIARWCGNKSVSDEYLRKAIDELPNLAIPWYLLGDDNKYRLLSYGAFRKDLLSTELPEMKAMTDESLLEMVYQPKFCNWYGAGNLWIPDLDKIPLSITSKNQ